MHAIRFSEKDPSGGLIRARRIIPSTLLKEKNQDSLQAQPKKNSRTNRGYLSGQIRNDECQLRRSVAVVRGCGDRIIQRQLRYLPRRAVWPLFEKYPN